MSLIFIQNVSQPHFLSKAHVDLVQQATLCIDVNSIWSDASLLIAKTKQNANSKADRLNDAM